MPKICVTRYPEQRTRPTAKTGCDRNATPFAGKPRKIRGMSINARARFTPPTPTPPRSFCLATPCKLRIMHVSPARSCRTVRTPHSNINSLATKQRSCPMNAPLVANDWRYEHVGVNEVNPADCAPTSACGARSWDCSTNEPVVKPMACVLADLRRPGDSGSSNGTLVRLMMP